MSRRSSSRKEDLVLKVNKKEVLEINSDDDDDKDDDDKTEGDDAEVVSLSDASSDEVIAPKKQRNVSYNKAAFSMPDDISKLMNRVLCTACGKQLNPMNHGAIRKHPWLKVITCKKCYKFLKSGPFTRDEDGTDEQCRWCGDGGRLYGCDYCNNCFCRSCIKRNIGRTEAAEMESDEATKSKWKCYMCKPKKIKTLQENCNKILDYIKKEEDKEKEREERAKQREKEKAQAKKDKKKEADKKDKRNSLPLPIKPKNESNESREKTPNKTGGFPAPKPKDSIVIDDSPEKPANKLATAKSHLPGYQSRPGDGVTQVQKVGNGVTQVTVGPKAKLPVSMPYKDGIKLNNTQSQSFGRSSSLQSLLAPKPIQPLPLNRPNLLGALTNQFPSAPTNAVTVDKKGITQVAKNNDIRALKEQIVPFNVETITEKLSTVAQAFSLTLNHVKTDLAIAKISSSNLFNSRSSAAYSVKTGLDVFCNNLRDIFNVQIITSSPSSDEPITLDDDKKSVKGLPNGNDSSIDKDSAKGSDKKEIKEEIKQIKKEMKVETNGPIEESKDQVKSEKNDTEEKMEIDDGDSKENKNSDKDTKVHKKDKSENSGENNDEMETSDTEQNESEGDTRKDKDTSPTSKISNKSSRVESDKSENTAAELDILKELADEINEANEKEESMEEEMETRRSSRRKKSQGDNEEDEADKSSETEQTPKRSSSRRKLQSDEKESQDEKNQKSTKKASEKDKDKDDDADGSSETEQEQRRSSRRKPEEKEKSKDTKDSSDKKSKDKSKIDTKNSKSSTKSEESKEADKPSVNDIGDDNEVISSDSDSSVSSAEFGKRRTRRKQKEKDEDKAKSESKSKGSNSEKSKSKDKSEKSDKKDKEKTDKKESRSTRSKKSSEDKEEYHSDSSNFDADLEKDIKSLSKDTKLTRSSRRTGKDESDSTEKEDKAKGGKKTAGKGKLDKSKKEDSVEESENSQEKSDEEEEDDPTPETTGEKLTKVNDRKSKNKKDESDDDTDADEDADNESKEDEEEDEENEEVDEDDLSPAQLRKLRAAQKKDEESDYEDMVASDNSDSEDPEVSFPKLSTPKKGKNKGGKGKKDDEVTIESDDSDFVTPKKNKKRKLKSDLLDAKVSDSDSDVGAKKKKKGRGKKRKKEEEEDEEPDPEDEIYSDDEKKKKGKGKRKRIRKVASSSDEEKEKGEEGGDEGEDDDLEDTPGGAHKRKKIRKVMANKKLADSTKEARKVEEERRKRIEERQKEFNAYVEVEGGEEEEEVPEGTEREKKEGDDSIAKILGTAKKVPVTTKCVLDMEKEAKKVLVEIDKTLVRKLKPHQVEAVRFMYNCCVESVERMKKEEGAGCILAHCMGLGKTLSVISFLHTMLRNTKLTKTTKCLVVCPLNTVLNWVNEFEIWLDDVDYEIEVYEMSKVKQNYERAQMLREWHEGGAGVMILGYDMYRNLVNGSHCKNKKQKATFYETLADPGPDIVVCDEGHVLKNDQTSLSKAMMKIKTRRRVVLTGTPLQNNLGEYHCMVSFVKPNLLGTRKEFSNRFVNPITNGQCSDSTGSDVKLMKRRAHILHEMLAGCVQRKDYSALTKFLPPKFEYVVSVRMSPLQCTLYENYLKEAGIIQNEEVHNKGGRLFRDYQALMRIWTHPWVLKLDEIRQENKKPFDDSEDSFIDDETDDDGEDSFISGSTTSESDADFNPKSKKKKKSKGKKGKKKGSDSDSDSDVKEVGEENEVIKKWSSKRRGNEEGAGSSWMQDMGYATGPKEVSDEWWAQYVKEEDEFKIELSGKLSLMFEILRMCEDIGDKVLIFSQSLLSLDIIEDFLHFVDESNNKEEGEEGENKDNKDKKEEEAGGSGTSEGEKKEKTEEEKKKEEQKKEQEKKREKYAQYGKSWTVGADYFRMDGSTSSQQRKAAQDSFNDPENYRARLFLISTKAGSLGINLVAANRVIIFDASWNPSHDIQSIFRVYRFGQIKPVYVYRFLAQGTMEEKIYERQVTKQSLSQRVVDEHQIERHFSANDLQELYKFQPDKLDDPDRKERPLPMLPKDHMLAELMSTQKDWIVTFHEHDSLLENIIEQELSEEEKKAAWEDYENEKKGLNTAYPMYGNMMNAQQRMNSALEFQNLVLQGQANLGQEAVLQIVQDLKARFPTLPPEVFSQRVQAVLRQVLTQRIMQQSDFQRRQLDQQKMAELNRLNQIKQQIQQQQAMLNSQQRSMGVGGNYYNSLYGVQALPSSGFSNNLMARAMGFQNPPAAHSSQSASLAAQKSNTKGDKK